MLGVLYEEGKGVGRDSSRALRWYRKSPKQSHAYAQCNIGFLYYDIGEMLLRDRQPRGALHYWRKALRAWRGPADRGIDRAQMAIGEMYWNGRGVAQDYQEALRWFRLALKKILFSPIYLPRSSKS
jgi:TPR repeat protein